MHDDRQITLKFWHSLQLILWMQFILVPYAFDRFRFKVLPTSKESVKSPRVIRIVSEVLNPYGIPI